MRDYDITANEYRGYKSYGTPKKKTASTTFIITFGHTHIQLASFLFTYTFWTIITPLIVRRPGAYFIARKTWEFGNLGVLKFLFDPFPALLCYKPLYVCFPTVHFPVFFLASCQLGHGRAAWLRTGHTLSVKPGGNWSGMILAGLPLSQCEPVASKIRRSVGPRPLVTVFRDVPVVM